MAKLKKQQRSDSVRWNPFDPVRPKDAEAAFVSGGEADTARLRMLERMGLVEERKTSEQARAAMIERQQGKL